MGLRLELRYPYTITRFVNSNEQAYDLVDNNGYKNGNLKIVEDTYEKIERNSKSADSDKFLGEEKFKLTEVDNGAYGKKRKTTHEFPNGKKYQIFENGNIKRIRKFENGKWSLIGFETPNFTWAKEQSYEILYSNDYREGLERSIESLPKEFQWKGLASNNLRYFSESLDELTDNLTKVSNNPKVATELFDLQLLTKGERKLILGEMSNYGKMLSKMGANLLKIAKIII